ncbi:MAG: hypothetical protein JSW27_20345 [Phycisphaerales bacterium]|nr:MAG: hypothetical protein JSW27_20345 [Phycisphaerales bacterium]
MNQDHRDIDRLLKANVEQQLADFDWDKLARSVGRRLATGDLRRRRGRPVVRAFAVAAAILLVVGVAAVVLLNRKTPNADTASGPGRATVVIARRAAEKGVGRCDVRIHDAVKPTPDDTAQRPRWCVVTLPEPASDDIGHDRNRASLACLF